MIHHGSWVRQSPPPPAARPPGRGRGRLLTGAGRRHRRPRRCVGRSLRTAPLGVPAPGQPSPVKRPLVKEPVAVGYGGAVADASTRRHAGRARGAAPGRQRRRRRGRRRRRARRHRAVLRRHRRRRLLRLLRRHAPARCTPSTAARPRPAAMTERRVHRPGDGHAVRLRRGACTSGLSVGVPGTPATWQTGAATVGHPVARRRCCSRRSGSPSAGFMVDADVRRPDRGQRGRVRATSARPARSTCPAAQPPAVGSTFRNPDLAAHLPADRPQGHRRLLPGALARDIVAHGAAPAGRRPAPTRPCGPAS